MAPDTTSTDSHEDDDPLAPVLHPDDIGSGSGSGVSVTEPLACVSCRARKLKCDRTKPACTRCVKVDSQCVYPESRRKPTVKRRNVKELEARLAQVEDYLKEVTKTDGQDAEADIAVAAATTATSTAALQDTEAQFTEFDFVTASAPPNPQATPAPDFGTGTTFQDLPNLNPGVADDDNFFGDGQLMGLGLSESLPPMEVMEDLNRIYFSTQHFYVPVVHPGRYMQAFYGGPLRKPPMSLQYAMWAMASHVNAKYSDYADVFYLRARQYADADEMKGYGEHFITLFHAQAYAIIATYEARMMLFTRAALTTAKCVRLVHMMGLDSLDGERDDIPPTLPAPTSWVDLEERRRTFWGAYAIDSHASIATGWPSLIQRNDITTKLPASEDAYMTGKMEESSFLEDVFQGASYGGFASTIVTCHILKAIMRHAHRTTARDKPEDFMNGTFWVRHRTLDNELSSLFMFLPEKLRLPINVREPSALHLNLNLHASVICLHHAAIEQAEAHGHGDSVKHTSICRLRTTAEEVANIIRMSSHNSAVFKSPLCALSMYCASTVYVYIAKENPELGLSSIDQANLTVIVQAMEAISRTHEMTKAFLQQACLDIERNNLSSIIRIPSLGSYRDIFGGAKSNIPLLARVSVGKHTEISPVLPGRLPLGNPLGRTRPTHLKLGISPLVDPLEEDAILAADATPCFRAMLGAVTRSVNPNFNPRQTAPQTEDTSAQANGNDARHSHKRKRVALSPGPGSGLSSDPPGGQRTNSAANMVLGLASQGNAFTPSSMSGRTSDNSQQFNYPQTQHAKVAAGLPDRTNSSASSSPMNQVSTGTETHTQSSHTSPGLAFGLGNTFEENRVDLRPFQDRISTPIWDQEVLGGSGGVGSGGPLHSNYGGDPWGILSGDVDWDGQITTG